LQHLSEFAAGGLGATISRMGNLAERLATRQTDDIEIRDVPFLRRVLGGKNPYYASIRYHQIRPQMARMWAHYKAADTQGRQRILAEHGDVIRAYRATESTLGRLRRAIHALEDHNAPAGKAQIERLKELEKQIENRAIRAWHGETRKAG
jgi:hypothetical protein